MKLVLEKKGQENLTRTAVTMSGGVVMMTPPIGVTYWQYRVALSKKQAIVGFPKFSTIGIGFQVERADWNTNLPYRCGAEEIYNHIKHNKGDSLIRKTPCIAAIKMIQEAVKADRGIK